MRYAALICCFLAITVQFTLLKAADEPVSVIHLKAGSITSLAWSPNGQILAVGTRQDIRLFNAQFDPTGTLPSPIHAESIYNRVRWSPSGNRLTVTSSGLFGQPCFTEIWNVSTSANGETVFALSNPFKICGGERWRHDGNSIAWLEDDELTVADYGPSVQTVYRFHNVSDFAWQHKGDTLAFATHDDVVHIWNSATHTLELSINKAGQTVAWSPDDRQIATVIKRGTITVPSEALEGLRMQVRAFNAVQIWDAATGAQIHKINIDNYRTTVVDAQWLHGYIGTTCRTIVVDFTEQGLCLWNIINGNLKRYYQFGGGSSWGAPAVWSPDRRRFYYFLYWHGTSLYVGKPGFPETRLVPLEDYAEINSAVDASWTSDSQFLTVADQEGHIHQVWLGSLLGKPSPPPTY